MKRWLRSLLLLLVCTLSVGAQAEDMLMVRSRALFEESMSALQEAISAQGYTLSRVQRVDIGLSESGFKTDKYRAVFFGKPDRNPHAQRALPRVDPLYAVTNCHLCRG